MGEGTTMPGILYVVSTPIGNASDLTFRAARILKDVAVIAAEDPQQTRPLLDRHGIETPLTSYHNFNKEEKIPVLLALLREGKSLALVSDAGTPAVADPGRCLIAQAVANGIPVTPVPGASALLAALTVSGLPADSFLFEGALPSSTAALRRVLRELRREPRTLVLYHSSGRLPRTLEIMREVLGNRYLVVTSNLTMPEENCLRGRVEDVLKMADAANAGGTVTLVVEGKPRARKVTNKETAATSRRVSGS
jgi:16S rRNA (cytidine1402-2'-O)-methyltransferase